MLSQFMAFSPPDSYQTMQSQNRGSGDGADGSVGGFSIATTGKASATRGALEGERPSAGKAGPRPPSICIRQGFAEALAKAGGGVGGGGGGKIDTTSGDAGGGGAGFNLLGLPPSPAPLSGVAGGASAWGATAGGSSRGLGDMMAGQVR